MDCIPYINDLVIEIRILKEIKKSDMTRSRVDGIDKLIYDKERIINKCKKNLQRLSDNQICYRLYLKMLNGMSPTKAVESIANENYYRNLKPTATSKLWKYYKNVKNVVKGE